jgi:hypothetical protein
MSEKSDSGAVCLVRQGRSDPRIVPLPLAGATTPFDSVAEVHMRNALDSPTLGPPPDSGVTGVTPAPWSRFHFQTGTLPGGGIRGVVAAWVRGFQSAVCNPHFAPKSAKVCQSLPNRSVRPAVVVLPFASFGKPAAAVASPDSASAICRKQRLPSVAEVHMRTAVCSRTLSRPPGASGVTPRDTWSPVPFPTSNGTATRNPKRGSSQRVTEPPNGAVTEM